MHKNPYKFRFIVGARKSSMKPLALLLNSALLHIKNHFKNYCEKIFETSKIRAFWSIENTASFCDAIHRVQITTGLKSIKTGDFSTMFTGLQHNDIKDAMHFWNSKYYR